MTPDAILKQDGLKMHKQNKTEQIQARRNHYTFHLEYLNGAVVYYAGTPLLRPGHKFQTGSLS